MSQQSLRILNAPNDMRNSLHRKFYHKNLLPLVKEHFTGTNISRLPFPRPPFLKLSVLKHFRQEFRLQLARFERTSIFFSFSFASGRFLLLKDITSKHNNSRIDEKLFMTIKHTTTCVAFSAPSQMVDEKRVVWGKVQVKHSFVNIFQ